MRRDRPKSSESPPRERPWQASVPFGKWFLTAVTAASFACILALASGGRGGDAVSVAITCFAVVIPLTGQYVFVMADETRGHHGSVLMRCMGALGLLSFHIGFTSMLASVSAVASTAWFVTVVLMAFVLMDAEKRGRKRRKRADAASAADAPEDDATALSRPVADPVR